MTAAAADRRAGRLTGLDVLRGIAALSVVLFHYAYEFKQVSGHAAPLGRLFGYGHYGVDLFFIISGFVILMTLRKTGGIRAFAASRIARLWPGFLACMFVTLALGVLLPTATWLPGGVTLHGVIANMTMAPALFGAPAIDNSYWTLEYEIFFYALISLAFAIRRGGVELFSAAWLAADFALTIVRNYGVFWRYWLPAHVIQVSCEYAHLFVAGMMLYRIRFERAGPVSYVLLLLALLRCAQGPIWSYLPISPYVYAALIVALCAAVFLATFGDRFWSSLRPLVFLGAVSYPLYLVHQTLGGHLLLWLADRHVDLRASVLLALAASLLLAWGVTTYVETPLRPWLRRALLRLQPHLASPSPRAAAGELADDADLRLG